MEWPSTLEVVTPRLLLEPLSLAHADEMVVALSADELYQFTGGTAPTLADLRARYARQLVGHSVDGHQGWLNWIIRRKVTQDAVGFVQATVSRVADGYAAELAWVVAAQAQGDGIATEAAGAVMSSLRNQRVQFFSALIHPAHLASGKVASHLGLTRTTQLVDGEERWATK